MEQNISVHPSAFVDSGANVGMYTKVWHFCHIESGAIIGENNNLGQNVYVGNNAIIGNACRLGNSVSIFSNVELHDFVFCAPFMVFTHVSFPRAAITRREHFDKTIVKSGTTLGANSTILPGLTIGMGTFLAAGSSLTKNSKDWSLMLGSPARQIGWVSAYGDKIPLPLIGCGEWKCPHTADIYVLEDSSLTRIAGPTDILKYRPSVKLERIKDKN